MAKEKRTTGIDVVGDVVWGTHMCQLYRTKEDLTNNLVPYFKAGLENNELCLWVTSKPLGVEEARAELHGAVRNLDDYIEKGQIEILDYGQWYTKAGKLDADDIFHRCLEKENLAIEKGFDGLRASGNMFWPEHKDWASLTGYESLIESSIDEHHMIAICSYSMDQCGAAEIVDLLSNHGAVLFPGARDWDVFKRAGRKRILDLRKSGLTFNEIGHKLGISKQRASQMTMKTGKVKTRRSTSKKDSSRKNANALLNVYEAADLLSIHPNTLRRWSNQGTIRTHRIGPRGDRRFRPEDLRDFLRRMSSTSKR